MKWVAIVDEHYDRGNVVGITNGYEMDPVDKATR
jgi:hypothetical protein